MGVGGEEVERGGGRRTRTRKTRRTRRRRKEEEEVEEEEEAQADKLTREEAMDMTSIAIRQINSVLSSPLGKMKINQT